ncbi:MAG: family NAD(P)-dependent oxidoreductase [Chitinophagaceae bacterium]|nr:family NAD(P)-dependent oxidoreductase [Chitinophagaceae bacterium]
MARIFITGSADGLGQLAAKLLIEQGHQVVLHARNAERARQALAQAPGAEKALVADLSSIEETKRLAADVNVLGHFDAIIHNAGDYKVSSDRTVDGLPMVFAVNSLAPYILTCLIHKPQRLIYISSDLHVQGDASLIGLTADSLRSHASPSYPDSKAHVLLLSNAVSRRWPSVYSNSVHPGWVPTKMGGDNAPDDLLKGAETQVWLATSTDAGALVSGRYFHHQKEKPFLPATGDVVLQEKFLALCEELSGVRFEIK